MIFLAIFIDLEKFQGSFSLKNDNFFMRVLIPAFTFNKISEYFFLFLIDYAMIQSDF
jgi:hypothetical protein